MRISTFTLIIVATTLANVGGAYAHAHLRSAIPAVDGTVAAAPTDVAITSSEGVEPQFSSIESRMTAANGSTKAQPKLPRRTTRF